MQGIEHLIHDEDSDSLPLGFDPEQAYCPVTNRIVLVSPFPQLIHELVRELSASCYDVMVFHHGEPDLLARLRADLLIIDHTRQEEGAASWLWLNDPGLAGVSMLHLVKPGKHDTSGYTNAKAGGSRSLGWPSPLPEALEFIRSLMGSSGGQSLTDDRTPSQSGLNTASEEGILQLKDLLVDLKRYKVTIADRKVDLTRTEFDLLKAIMETAGSVLSRQDLMDRIWGEGYFGGSNTVDVHVKSLRQKLGDDPRHPRYIATVRGIGYRAADG